MFDAKPNQPDVDIGLIVWLNLPIRTAAMPKTLKIGAQFLETSTRHLAGPTDMHPSRRCGV
jgi:hypothetical protein